MASELVNIATSDKLTEVDWAKNIEICEIVAHDQRYILYNCPPCSVIDMQL